jgi:hypothetical protein
MDKNSCLVQPYSSKVSLHPLVDSWMNSSQGNMPVYKWLIEKIQADELLGGVMNDRSQWESRQDMINELMQVLLPVNLVGEDEIYVVTRPFTFDLVYSTSSFSQLKEKLLGSGGINAVIDTLNLNLRIAAVGHLLEQTMGKKLQGHFKPVVNIPDQQELNKYFEFALKTNLIVSKGEPAGIAWETLKEQQLTRVNELEQQHELVMQVDLTGVEFEGLGIVHIRDLTERTVVSNIKNLLLDYRCLSEEEGFGNLEKKVRDLGGSCQLKMGITSLFCINKKYVFPSLLLSKSMLLEGIDEDEKRQVIAESLQKYFDKGVPALIIDAIDEVVLQQYSFLQPLKERGVESLVLYPLWQEEELIGILEVSERSQKFFNQEFLNKMEPVVSIIELALQKTLDHFEGQLNKIIKEQFTAIQPAVEWSFTDAAVDYLMRIEKDEEARVRNIVFNGVYPLYGAIDIRNSSVERNKAIQQDLIEQLEMVEKIIKQAIQIRSLPKLRETYYRIRKYKHAVRNFMLSEEEFAVNRFLKNDVVELFQFLGEKIPAVKDMITDYFQEVNSSVDLLYRHRKNFDDSISFVNTMLARFIDQEEKEAQKMFPHYFERFVTDGVDFNIYIGQSIAPQETFNEFYLRNLKLWQLGMLARAAQLSRRWEGKLAVPLQTTQLVLAHSYPISISFRHAERKFDVDGAYNIRYEIIKKRIDKVCIRDTNERLTQPGKIAIVYMHNQEAKEFEDHIDFLRHEGLLEGEIEYLDLEELQGVSGLKALRIGVADTSKHEKAQGKMIHEKKQ